MDVVQAIREINGQTTSGKSRLKNVAAAMMTLP